MVRLLTLISGVLAIVLSNIAAFHLPVTASAVITGVGGLLLAILAFLEHPTTVSTAAVTKAVAVRVMSTPPPKGN